MFSVVLSKLKRMMYRDLVEQIDMDLFKQIYRGEIWGGGGGGGGGGGERDAKIIYH